MNPSDMLLSAMEEDRARLIKKISELQKIQDSDKKYLAQQTVLKLETLIKALDAEIAKRKKD